MNILLDLHWLKPGWTGGIETLAWGFLESLIHQKLAHRFIVCAPVAALIDRPIPSHPAIQWIPVDTPGRTLRRLGGKPRFSDIRADIVLAFSGYVQPEFMATPFVVIIPDLQHEALPHFFTLTERIERQYLVTKAVRGAAHCLTLSRYTRGVLMERYGLSPDAVSVVYPGPASRFFMGAGASSEVESVLRQYELPHEGYFYYPAHTWPHKNHRVLLEALAIIRESGHPVPFLVCTGHPKNAHDSFLRQIRSLNLQRWVRWLGYLPIEAVPAVYAGALALVYPSKYEGFGFPLLEAMAAGCPVISSHVTCLPEIAGDAAWWVDPEDPKAWAEAMMVIMNQPERRVQMRRRGRQHCRSFSWERFTTTVLTLLEEVGRPTNDVAETNLKASQDARFHEDSCKRWRWAWKGYIHIREWGQVLYRSIMAGIDRWRLMPVQTRRLMDHPEPWWDGWVGPHLELQQTIDKPVRMLIIQGYHDPPRPNMPLSLTVALNGVPITTHRVKQPGDFVIKIKLDRPLKPGRHAVTISSYPWWVAHRRWRNGDYRPLAWRWSGLQFH